MSLPREVQCRIHLPQKVVTNTDHHQQREGKMCKPVPNEGNVERPQGWKRGSRGVKAVRSFVIQKYIRKFAHGSLAGRREEERTRAQRGRGGTNYRYEAGAWLESSSWGVRLYERNSKTIHPRGTIHARSSFGRSRKSSTYFLTNWMPYGDDLKSSAMR